MWALEAAMHVFITVVTTIMTIKFLFNAYAANYKPRTESIFNGYWEVTPLWYQDEMIGYRVSWSKPDLYGNYLHVAVFKLDECKSAGECWAKADLHCENLQRCDKQPFDYSENF